MISLQTFQALVLPDEWKLGSVDEPRRSDRRADKDSIPGYPVFSLLFSPTLKRVRKLLLTIVASRGLAVKLRSRGMSRCGVWDSAFAESRAARGLDW